MSLTTIRARLILSAFIVLLVAGLSGKRSIAPTPRDASSIGDLQLQLVTIERIRAGEWFYTVVGDELRKHHYPTMPLWNWRTPLHYTLVAIMSVERAGLLLLLMGVSVVFTGVLAYAQQSAMRGASAGLILAITMGPAMVARPAAVVFPENWAGVLLALSLNAYVSRKWEIAAALGVLAVFVRELAAPYAICCGVLALMAGRKGELRVWLVGGLLYCVYYSVHAVYALQAIQHGDLAREQSYIQWLGPLFVLQTLYVHGGLSLAPPFATPIAASYGLAGACAPSAPGQLKLSLLAYFILFSAVGQPFNFYWGHLTAPIWAHAFIHGNDGLKTLLTAAFAKRMTIGPTSRGLP